MKTRCEFTRADLSAEAYEYYSNTSPLDVRIDAQGNYCIDGSIKFNSIEQVNAYFEEMHHIFWPEEEEV